MAEKQDSSNRRYDDRDRERDLFKERTRRYIIKKIVSNEIYLFAPIPQDSWLTYWGGRITRTLYQKVSTKLFFRDSKDKKSSRKDKKSALSEEEEEILNSILAMRRVEKSRQREKVKVEKRRKRRRRRTSSHSYDR